MYLNYTSVIKVTRSIPEKIVDLIHNGSMTTNALARLAEQNKICTRKTALKHLPELVKQNRIKRRKIGQYVEWSIYNEIDFVESSGIVEEISEFLENSFPKVIQKMQTYQSTKPTKRRTVTQIELFHIVLENGEYLLLCSSILNFLISLKHTGSFNINQLKQIDKSIQKQLVKLFEIAKKIDPSFHNYLFNSVLNKMGNKLKLT